MPRVKTSEKKIQRERNLPYMDIFEHFLFITREFYELKDSNLSLAGRLSFVTLMYSIAVLLSQYLSR